MKLHERKPYRYSTLTGQIIYRRHRQTEQRNIPEENPATIQATYTHGSYGSLLFDPKWKTKRAVILHRDSYQCILCKENSNLQIHHRQYHFLHATQTFKLPWDYSDHLLITLCERCHSKGHRQHKVPTIYL